MKSGVREVRWTVEFRQNDAATRTSSCRTAEIIKQLNKSTPIRGEGRRSREKEMSRRNRQRSGRRNLWTLPLLSPIYLIPTSPRFKWPRFKSISNYLRRADSGGTREKRVRQCNGGNGSEVRGMRTKWRRGKEERGKGGRGREEGEKRVKNLRDFYWPRENVCRRDKDVRLSFLLWLNRQDL